MGQPGLRAPTLERLLKTDHTIKPLEQVTLLTCCDGHAAQKIFAAGSEVKPYRAGKTFSVATIQLRDLGAFHLLLLEIEQNPSLFVVRGKPKAFITSAQLVSRKSVGADATFEAKAAHLFCVDIDDIVAPTGMDPCSAAAIEYAISKLPNEFQNADVVAQFSNSAGTERAGQKIKLHLWFWGARKYDDRELRRWAQTIKDVDPALYSAVQPHYTARALFEGIADPFEKLARTSYIKKARPDVEIRLPELSAYAAAPRQMHDHELDALARDDDGKVIDGRERLLCNIRWSVLMRNHVTTVEQFHEHVMAAFEDQAILLPTVASSNAYTSDVIWALCLRDWEKWGEMVPESSRSELQPAEAVALLVEQLQTALKSKTRVAIKASAGLGKSVIAAQQLVALPDLCKLYIDIFVPSRKEQLETRVRLLAAAERAGVKTDILVIEGRSKDNCIQFEAANALSGAGLSPSRMLCKTDDAQCSGFEGCPYRAQFLSKRPAIRIYTHAHLTTPRPEGLPAADIAVIDESFHGVAAHVQDGIRTGDLVSLPGLNFRLPKVFSDHNPADALKDYKQCCETSKTVARAISSGRPILEELRAGGIDPETLRNTADFISRYLRYPRVEPNTPFEVVKNAIARSGRVRTGTLASTLRAIAKELETSRSESHAIKVNDDGTYTLCIRKPFPRLCDVETIVILDADCDANNLLPMIPDTRIVTINARSNAYITQIDDLTFSRTYLGIGEGQPPKRSVFEAIAERVHKWPGKSKLVVTYRALIGFLKPLLPGVKFCYFGNLRGSNEFEDCRTVFVIGRQFIPNQAVENIARALHWDSSEQLVFGNPVPRRYRVGAGVLRSYDELDPRLQSVRAASREAETRQGLARARLVHAHPRKEVILLSSQPIGLPVDAIIRFKTSKAERIFDQLDGVLPFGADELVRLSGGEFSDVKAARRWRGRPETTPAAIRDYYKRAGLVIAETSYRHAQRRGPSARLLVDPLRHPMPHITLPMTLAAPGEEPKNVLVEPLPWKEVSDERCPDWLSVWTLAGEAA